MADRIVTCPLCGLEFQPTDTLCEHGCPLRSACGLLRCPACEYEFPETPRAVSWLKRLFGKTKAPVACPPGTRTVRDLRTGERATVSHLAGESSARHNALAVFGLVPGSEIVLLQRHPSYVVEVGETVIALEAEVAASILVEPTEDDDALGTEPAAGVVPTGTSASGASRAGRSASHREMAHGVPFTARAPIGVAVGPGRGFGLGR